MSVDSSASRARADRASDALARRTRALAAPVRVADEGGEGRLLVFVRAGERFGVPLERVATTLAPTSITPVPGAEAPVRGVVAWRSRPLVVYDLATAAGAPPGEAALVVVGDFRRAVALIADALEDVAGHATEAPAGAGDGRFISHVLADATLVIDADRLLTLFDTP